jgi:hypothetical protein
MNRLRPPRKETRQTQDPMIGKKTKQSKTKQNKTKRMKTKRMKTKMKSQIVFVMQSNY